MAIDRRRGRPVNLKDQVAMVTGAGRGIGRATALALSSRGAQVVLTSRTQSELKDTVAAIAKQTPDARCLIVPGDVSDEAFVTSLFASVVSRFGPVTILVNNAGTIHLNKVADISVSDWERTFAVNVRGSFLCARAIFRSPPIPASPRAIVNISSLGGIRGTEKFPGLAAYVASKFAVVGLTESLAVEGKPLGIRVNCVAPGAVDTVLLRQAAPHLRTTTTPDDIAKIVCFLADHEQSGSMTGATIEVHSNE